MQVSNINNNIINIKSSQQSSPFKSGTQIKATVTQVNSDGTVLMKSDIGVFTANNTTGFALNPGDAVSLLVTSSSSDGSSATTSLTQINGQPMDQNVSLSELHLIDLGVLPNSSNLRLYDILNKFQLPLTKDLILNLKNIFSQLPTITDEQAAFMAAAGIKPTLANLHALTSIGTIHEDVASLINESMSQIISEYGISDSAINDIISSLGTVVSSAVPGEQQASSGINTAILGQQPQNTVTPGVATLEANAPQIEGVPIQPSVSGSIVTESPDLAPTVEMPTAQIPSDGTIPLQGENALQATTLQSSQFIPDKPQYSALLTNYLTSSLELPQGQNEAIAVLMPKVIDSISASLTDKLASSPNVTLKDISDLKLPENLPKELQQIIAALPKDAQAQLDLILPKVLQSAREFLSIMLIRHAGSNLQVKVDPEATTGLALKQNIKSMSSNVASVLTDKPGDAAQRTVTSLKLSDNTMSFIQIPITINNRKSTAEMYVVKRDGHKKLSLEDGVKMVFALNTENLGRIESVISANTKDLSLNIRVENSTVKEALEKEIPYLKNLLSTTDFHIAMLKVTQINKKITVLNAHTFFGYKQLDITI